MKALYIGRGGATAGFVDSVTADDGLVGVLLDVTSFYYESGEYILYVCIATGLLLHDVCMYIYVCICRWSNLRHRLFAESRWNQVFCHQCADVCRICKHVNIHTVHT